jgi:aminoglycoside phosphotransferase (APT) family kinase protein
MLTHADANVARRDPAVPGLAVLLDPDAVLELLTTSLPFLAPQSVRPVYVRYKPATRCLVAYEVRTANGTVPVHANAHSTERAIAATYPGLLIADSASSPGVIMPAPGIVVSAFPQDRTLRSLARVWQPTGMNRRLEKLLPGCPGLWDAQLRLLAYKPERRCVAGVHGIDGTAAILKAYTASGYERAMTGARNFRSSGPLRVARVIGRSRRHRLIAFEWLPGETLSGLLGDAPADVDRVGRVGAALAALHLQDVLRRREHGSARGADEVGAAAAGIRSLCPELADRAERLARRLSATLQQVKNDVPLHGDFHTGQVLVAQDTIAVVDTDRASRGDPRMDIATFIAHLQCDALEGLRAPSTIERLGDALIDGYERSTGRAVRNGLAPHLAAALLRLAPRPFRVRHPDWPAVTAEILSRAEALVTPATPRRSRRRSVQPVTDPFGVLADEPLSLPPAALDAEAMACRLAQLAGARKESVDVDAVRVVRHKPGRRCLIEYDVRIPGASQWASIETVVGKVRGKGADTRTYGLSCTLWRNGFGEDSPDGVSIPRPLGVLPDLKMWLQVKVPGTAATSLGTDERGVELGERIARAIRKLHCHPAPAPPLHTTDDELRILRERLQLTAAALPHYAPRLHAIVERCARIARTLPRVEPRGIHRDFYADQVLVHDQRAYLLDLDLYALGDPALDIGNFLGHTVEYSLRVFGDAGPLTPFEAAMKRCFLSLDATVSAAAIEIYKTLTLARLIHISTVLPARRPFTDAILGLVESRLDQHIGSRSATIRDVVFNGIQS